MSKATPKQAHMAGPKEETKHSRYYANHRLERQAQSRKYKRKRAAELRASGGPWETESSATKRQLPSVGTEDYRNAVRMCQEYMTLRNNIDDWLNRAVPQFPVMLSDLRPQFATHLLSGASLASELHGFVDRYISHLPALDNLDIWRFFKGVCSMQQALGNGRAKLVFELAPHMEIPQPNWGSSTLWVPRGSSIPTDTIYDRLLDLRTRSNRLRKISQKMQRYDGNLIWRYEEVERCIQSARCLYTEWYTMLDDLEGDPTDSDLLMFLKEVANRVATESPTESPTGSPTVVATGLPFCSQLVVPPLSNRILTESRALTYPH
ncbi:hypothetical protein GYMLUDRAFT_252282 [Collybiopsis luxurians FD-317 M1]|uniref:Uncharacterized protein n=1 Tax=Collybiopsis luxurians FD-317 M1 TaxID=944289 RepID=A0A0D0ALR5_9AGAR|nr:hypothetical protein GYMLUDRAFT_252282 [Collybiopsis luxurians FD-317 M1]